jgi:aspartate--ammonia ligase
MEMRRRYETKLGLVETERGIKLIKDTFEHELAQALNLERVSAPRFLEVGNGLQDDLAGTQVPVSFAVKHSTNPVEMVHSLAKWKRLALARYGFQPGTGLYTDMDAVRKDEVVDETHSNYVDQWDWEKVLLASDRNLDYLKETVRLIYAALLHTEAVLSEAFPILGRLLPGEIAFIHTQDLEDRYPELSPAERENRAAEELGAYFLIGIGGQLKSSQPHDLRAADYDDWITETEPGMKGMNGDIIVLDQMRGKALELSSMGIRVDKVSLLEQLRIMGLEDRKSLPFHRDILSDRLPLTIGGGIGQSRLCMLLLQKFHIGEVQASIWPQKMRAEYEQYGIIFL